MHTAALIACLFTMANSCCMSCCGHDEEIREHEKGIRDRGELQVQLLHVPMWALIICVAGIGSHGA